MCVGTIINKLSTLLDAPERIPAATASANTAGFDPATAGTPDNEWQRLLEQAPHWAPSPGTLVVAAPHPDDEIFGAGGLIRCWAMAGLPVTILSVTDGEAADASRSGLDLVRREELREALRKLALQHVAVKRLGIPDGRVAEHANRLRNAIREHVVPGATLIAPFERDGHPDHEAVGKTCLEIAAADRVAIARYPIWAWHHTRPTALAALRWGRFALDSAARRAKSRAVQCFESQLRPPRGPAVVPSHVLRYFTRPYEAFVL